MSTSIVAALALLGSTAYSKMTEAPYFYRSERPMVIAHRGAFGHFPEHSLGSYTDAYYGGADFIEMDLQATKDGELVAQHDPYLDVTTNVAEYADQFKSKFTVGQYHYFVHDFTMRELKLLKRKQRYSDRSQLVNDKYEMVTLQEVIDTVNMLNADAPRTVNSNTRAGLYIEIKDWAA